MTDLLVIGGGPAGINAALYAARKGLEVVVLSQVTGGQLNETAMIENYLGSKAVLGYELADNFSSHLAKYDVPVIEGAHVKGYERVGNDHEVTLANGEKYVAKTLLIATGSVYRKLGVPGEEEFVGKGVSYCAICDGPFFRNKDVLIAGGGNAAVEASLDLAKYANSVTIVHRSQFRADKVLVDAMEKNPKITYHLRTRITEIFGDNLLRGVKALDLDTGEEKIVNGDGIFVEIGQIPNSEIFKGKLELNDNGCIITNDMMATNIPGVYAAGNVRAFPYKQIIIAAAEGATAALHANEYLMQSYGK